MFDFFGKTKDKKGMVAVLFAVAVSDGNLDKRELDMIYRLAQEEYGLSESQIEDALSNSEKFLTGPPKSAEDRESLFRHMLVVAMADRKITNGEEILIKSMGHHLGIPDFLVENLLEEFKNKFS